MDDGTLYTLYYGQHHASSTESSTVPSISRRGQGVVCAFLAFGAGCGVSTVAVGFVAHKSTIIWPVVAAGLIGVILGLLLAYRRATGGWVWDSPSSIDSSGPRQHAGTEWTRAPEGAALGGHVGGNGGGCNPLPMYYAHALDIEMGVVVRSPYFEVVGKAVNGGVRKRAEGTCDVADEAREAVVKETSSDLSSSSSTTAEVADGAAIAAEYGTVMCGFPLAGADGYIDTRPVLVLQPKAHMLVQLLYSESNLSRTEQQPVAEQPAEPRMVYKANPAAPSMLPQVEEAECDLPHHKSLSSLPPCFTSLPSAVKAAATSADDAPLSSSGSGHHHDTAWATAAMANLSTTPQELNEPKKGNESTTTNTNTNTQQFSPRNDNRRLSPL